MQHPSTFKHIISKIIYMYSEYSKFSKTFQLTKYSIKSTLTDYQKIKKIQLSFNDKPGDLLPLLSIAEIKSSPDILVGLHPVDVNTINDLYYLSEDKISNLTIYDNVIEATNMNGELVRYNAHEPFDHQNIASKRISFLIGYMQAEKLMKDFYTTTTEFKILRDNITTLGVLDTKTNEEFVCSPMDILFSDMYLNFSKKDIGKIGYICGQMSKI